MIPGIPKTFTRFAVMRRIKDTGPLSIQPQPANDRFDTYESRDTAQKVAGVMQSYAPADMEYYVTPVLLTYVEI